MGYILPITHHTYKNYQYRMIENEKGPHHIGSTFKVVFRKMNDDVGVNEKHHLYVKQLTNNDPPMIKKKPSYQIDALQKAELTGKGGKVNVQV